MGSLYKAISDCQIRQDRRQGFLCASDPCRIQLGISQVNPKCEAFGKGENNFLMEPMLKGEKEKLKAAGWGTPLKGKTISTDTGRENPVGRQFGYNG